MNKYHYKAKNRQGKSYTGIVEARDENLAAKVLQEKGFLVTALQLKGDDLFSNLQAKVLNRVSFSDKVNFTRQLATMINSGLPLTDALRILEEQASPGMARLLGEIVNQVESGASLSKAMEAHPDTFNRVYIALVKAGEEAGVLDKILNRLAENLEKQKEFNGKVKGALIYPVVVIIGMGLVAVVMMIFVIPKLTSMYNEFNAELPMPTQILLAMTDFFTRFWWFILALIIGFILFFPQLLKKRAFRIKYDQFLFKVPVLGKLRVKTMLTDFARTLGLLIGAGVLVIDALEIVRDSLGSPIYEDALDQAAQSVQKGYPLASALADTSVFPNILPQMIAVGEETGKTDEILEKIANYFGQESEQSVKNLTSALEPLIMIVLGLGVGFLVIAILMPIYNLTSSF